MVIRYDIVKTYLNGKPSPPRRNFLYIDTLNLENVENKEKIKKNIVLEKYIPMQKTSYRESMNSEENYEENRRSTVSTVYSDKYDRYTKKEKSSFDSDRKEPPPKDYDEEKRYFLYKFEMLKKTYPNATIPEVTIHTSLERLKLLYEDTMRKLAVGATIDSYKTYLIYSFAGCEYIFGNYIGFDMEGFTQQQIIQIGTYEKLLLELGEKSYVPDGSRYPVELRLAGTILANVVFFIISKNISKNTNVDLFTMFNNINSNYKPPPSDKKEDDKKENEKKDEKKEEPKKSRRIKSPEDVKL